MKPVPGSLVAALAVMLATSAAAQSKWIVQEGHSAKDNSRAVSLKLLPDRGAAGLSALCIEGNTKLSIVALEPLPSPPSMLQVSYRIDDAAWQTRSFLVEAKADSFTIEGAPAQDMLKQLIGHMRLSLKFERQAGLADAAELTIGGLDAAIGSFRQVCNW